MNTDIIIIGGGAAGLFSAASTLFFSKKQNLPVPSITIVEKMERCGNKIGLTGKGRCNITNTKPWNDFSSHIYPDKNFLRPSFYEMSNTDTIAFFESIGLPVVVERGDRVFPQSYRAQDVSAVLINYLKKNGVDIINRFNVESVNVKADSEYRFAVKSSGGAELSSKYLIISTGGLSYPATGSTGDGYTFARSLGHKIVNCFPSLTALIPFNYPSLGLQGISLKNVNISLLVNGTCVQSEFGDLDFTNDGIEGPIGFKISRKAVYNLVNGQKVSVDIDLKPAVEAAQIRNRIAREFAGKNPDILQMLGAFLPKQLVKPFFNLQKPLNVNNLPDKLKLLHLNIESCVGYRRSVVTAGGVDLKEISQKTMQSKLVEGLYFAGEVVNLDGDTGGYNLQIAFSTGALAAKSILKNYHTTSTEMLP